MKTVEFKVTVYMELDFKDIPEEIAKKLEETLLNLKSPKKTVGKRKMKIDVEKIE